MTIKNFTFDQLKKKRLSIFDDERKHKNTIDSEPWSQQVKIFFYPNGKQPTCYEGNYANPSRKNFATNKIDLYYIHDNWNMVLLDLNDFVPKIKKGQRYIVVVIKTLGRLGWTDFSKNENAQTI